jgi:hypothetical protein
VTDAPPRRPRPCRHQQLIPLPPAPPLNESSGERKLAADIFEQNRLDSLRSYGILDSEPEPMFDRLAALAARVCGTPISQ